MQITDANTGPMGMMGELGTIDALAEDFVTVHLLGTFYSK